MPKHVRKGDTVMVTSGRDRGKTGEVLRVIPEDDRVVVQGVNMVSKNLRPTQSNPQGGMVHREASLHISNVSPVADGKPTRVRFEAKPDGSKVRVAVRNGEELGVVHGPREKKSGGAGAPPARKKSAKKSTSKKAGAQSKKKSSKKKTTKKTAKKTAGKKAVSKASKKSGS